MQDIPRQMSPSTRDCLATHALPQSMSMRTPKEGKWTPPERSLSSTRRTASTLVIRETLLNHRLTAVVQDMFDKGADTGYHMDW